LTPAAVAACCDRIDTVTPDKAGAAVSATVGVTVAGVRPAAAAGPIRTGSRPAPANPEAGSATVAVPAAGHDDAGARQAGIGTIRALLGCTGCTGTGLLARTAGGGAMAARAVGAATRRSAGTASPMPSTAMRRLNRLLELSGMVVTFQVARAGGSGRGRHHGAGSWLAASEQPPLVTAPVSAV
jgi:hypothetical protein